MITDPRNRRSDAIEELLRELVTLSRPQVANQAAVLARQAAQMTRIKRRSAISLSLFRVVVLSIAYIGYLTQEVPGYHR